MPELYRKRLIPSECIHLKNDTIVSISDGHIIDTSYDKNTDTYIFTDLLADVIIENDGFVRVVDLDELADACRMSIISNDMLVTSLHRLNALLSIIYNGDFKDYLDELERYEVLNPALNHLSKLQ